MSERRIWWMQISERFMQSVEMRALRRIDRGAPDIYMRILTMSLQTGCKIVYESYFDTIEEEIADRIREEDVNAVKKVLDFLKARDLMIKSGDDIEEYYLPHAAKLSQSKGASADRTKKYRAKNKQSDGETSQSDGETSQSDGETSQSDGETSQSHDNKSKSKSKSKNKSSSKQRPPTQEEAEGYFLECNFKSDPKAFFNYNQSRGWKSVEDWKAAAALWETREKETSDRQRGRRCDNQFNSFEQRNDSKDLDEVLLTATREKYSAELGASFTGSR